MKFFGFRQREEPKIESVYINPLKQQCHDTILEDVLNGQKYFHSKDIAEKMNSSERLKKLGLIVSTKQVGNFIGSFRDENNGLKIEKRAYTKSTTWSITLNPCDILPRAKRTSRAGFG